VVGGTVPSHSCAEDRRAPHSPCFINLISVDRTEITGDLMRRRTDAPNGIMDYLFLKLFRYARERGYARVSLAMAPMTGFQECDKPTAEEHAIHGMLSASIFSSASAASYHYKAKLLPRGSRDTWSTGISWTCHVQLLHCGGSRRLRKKKMSVTRLNWNSRPGARINPEVIINDASINSDAAFEVRGDWRSGPRILHNRLLRESQAREERGADKGPPSKYLLSIRQKEPEIIAKSCLLRAMAAGEDLPLRLRKTLRRPATMCMASIRYDI